MLSNACKKAISNNSIQSFAQSHIDVYCLILGTSNREDGPFPPAMNYPIKSKI